MGQSTGLGNEVANLSDTSLSAAVLLTIDAHTTGIVLAAQATTIFGTFPEVFAAYTSQLNGTILGLGNEAITITAPLTVAQFNTLAAQTTGVITATIIEGNIATLSGLTETGHALLINVTDASVAASALNTLNSKTTVAVNSTAITITGAAADINTAYTSNAAGSITGLGNEAVTITDTSINASALITLNAFSFQVVNAAAVIYYYWNSCRNQYCLHWCSLTFLD